VSPPSVGGPGNVAASTISLGNDKKTFDGNALICPRRVLRKKAYETSVQSSQPMVAHVEELILIAETQGQCEEYNTAIPQLLLTLN